MRAVAGLCLGALLATSACNTDQEQALDQDIQDAQQNAAIIEGSYIVVLKEDGTNSARQLRDKSFASREDKAEAFEANHRKVSEGVDAILRKHSIGAENLKHVYSATLAGFAATLSKEEVASLKLDDRVDRIEADMRVELNQVKSQPAENASVQAQSTPWGISRVGGAVNYANGYYWAWVLDTGIDLDHPDLNVNTSYSRSFVGGTADDQNGHGTHVAGTIAAKNNTIGVVGVAAGATVVSVRVLNAQGSGSMSGILSGVDWVSRNAYSGDVANMSLGGGAYSTLDQAVINASNQGIWFAVAAGNESQNANNVSPARANGSRIRTVSAHDSNDRFASFSNYANPPIDFCAPGVSIYSTWLNGGYRTISGTSMATPHVAGIMLVNSGTVNTRGYVTGDPDGNADRLARR
ncbi:S8 family peptidase [Cesiribacter andamanensis]|uniref:Extracellular serine proteinase n=1 Tax=Cesiribacter andamanensis AMV16 TaxID=1279009 RepID=M7N5F9_9BACT|nr:S8 family peptidase [Cesiribacter andamanensis]EMR03853.1 Extracellular serine proteinase precursor [Cesiribacter andamanensis AMV16]